MPVIADLSKADGGNDIPLIPDATSRSRRAIRASFAIDVPPFRKQSNYVGSSPVIGRPQGWRWRAPACGG
jgi:hypothetical protein